MVRALEESLSVSSRWESPLRMVFQPRSNGQFLGPQSALKEAAAHSLACGLRSAGDELLETYEDEVSFYSPDACFEDARKYIPDVFGGRRINPVVAFLPLPVKLTDRYRAKQ
jgi:hypothetical protein